LSKHLYIFLDITLNSKVYLLAINEGVTSNRKLKKGTRDSKLASNLHAENAETGILFEIYRSTQSIEGGNFDTTSLSYSKQCK